MRRGSFKMFFEMIKEASVRSNEERKMRQNQRKITSEEARQQVLQTQKESSERENL